jgi:streptogramin lyase
MRAGTYLRAWFLVLAVLGIAAAPAAAAEPTLYELPESTHAYSFAPTPDGTIWFSPVHGNRWEGPKGPRIGRLGTDGSLAELGAQGFGEPVVGPQGELWATRVRESPAKKITLRLARLSPTGQVEATYILHLGHTFPSALAVTPEAVWFVRRRPKSGETIERYTPADGRLRGFALSSQCAARALTGAADGSLWFAQTCEPHGGRGTEAAPGIGHIDPSSGAIRRWRLGRKDYPAAIALGADGSVWFGVSHQGYSAPDIGRIEGNGTVTEWPAPNAYLGSIAIGADGRVWFQSSMGGQIFTALNSIGPDGDLATPVCADPECKLEPVGITAAADGSLVYGLREPHSIGGGGFTQIMEGESIANEAGFIARLVP